jgi:enoyl-CoA hydratase/carnithine racemase
MPMLWMQPLLMDTVRTGEMVEIQRLRARYFVNRVEPTAVVVRECAMTLARTIRDNAPLSVRAGKQSLLAGMALGAVEGLAEAKRLHVPVYASEDAQEGPRACGQEKACVGAALRKRNC